MNKNIYGLAESLVKGRFDRVILLDRGISFEVAKKYKELGGKKVIGAVPLSDHEFGITHLRPYREAKIEGRMLIDEVIDSGSWYKQDATHALFGDCVLLLGKSLGSIGEMNLGFYIYSLLSKKNGFLEKANTHPNQIMAGRKIPFSLIVYLPFTKDQLDYEMEHYIKKVGGIIAYAKNIEEFQNILRVLAKEYNSKKR
jgi:hypothetical protein